MGRKATPTPLGIGLGKHEFSRHVLGSQLYFLWLSQPKGISVFSNTYVQMASLRIITWVFYCWRFRVVIMGGLLPYRRLNSWYYGLARRIAWYWVFFLVSPVLMALESCFLRIQNLLENEHGYRSANYRRAHILIFVFWSLESSAWSGISLPLVIILIYLSHRCR